MADLDERAIIRMFQHGFGNDPRVTDDVERFAVGDVKMAAKADTLVSSTDVPPGMSPRDAARKSVAACVSDFAAKGVRPRWAVISVTMPDTYGARDFEMVSQGLSRASSEFGCAVLGGDTNVGPELSITVCLFGIYESAPLRRGAAEGDQILVSGPFGLAAAGLHALLNGSGQFAAESVLRPTPRLDFGIQAARHFTSSMDSSDGLSGTLNEMARQSGVSMVLNADPAGDGVARFARDEGLDPDELVYHGGEEYEIVFTAPPSRASAISRAARETGAPVMRVGYVADGEGVFLERGGSRSVLPDRGWTGFGRR